MLATAGNLVFWGDIAQVLRAFDAETGKVLWQSEPLGATIQTSTITYAVAASSTSRWSTARADRRPRPRGVAELTSRRRIAATR